MGQIVLPARQRKLLRILSEQKDLITGVGLAHKMEVSDRTVRNDILEINRVLEQTDVHIDSIRGKGYVLNVENSTLLHNLIYSEDILLTQEDRVRYLTIRLICSDKPIKLGELEDEMFLSRTTLEKDIRIVNERYSSGRPYLKLIRKENVIYFEEKEERKRSVLNELFSKEWDYNSEDGIHFRDSFFDPRVFDTISIHVKEYLRKYRIKLSDIGLVHFVFAILIAHLRIENGHCLCGERQSLDSDPDVISAVDELCNRLEEVLNISFSLLERDYFSFLLIQKKLFDLDSITRENVGEYVDPKYVVLVNSFLNDIKKEYSLDLLEDDMLFIGLVLHVRSLVNRLRYAYELKSTVLDKLKNRYPFAFEISLLFIGHFKNMFHMEIEENELSYIAAHLGSAVKRLVDNALNGEITVAVASHLNYSSSQLMITKLKSVYNQTIKLVGPFSIYEKEKISTADAALVLSTAKIKDMPVKDSAVVVVSSFLENEDLEAINERLDGMKRDLIHPKLPVDIVQYFDEELFYFGMDLDSTDKVVAFLAQELLKKEYVAPEFLNEVLKRENVSSTAFENGIAMPHPLGNCCYKTVISVAILKKPISWNGQKVQCVCLLAIREEDRKYIVRFFDLVVNTFGNRARAKKIIDADNFNKFISIIT